MTPPASADRVWTIPNTISMLRIALIFVFAYLIATGRDGWAVATLAVTGFSDFFDGYLARKWNQATRLGAFLDPTADRLLTTAIVIGLAARGVIPWWGAAVLFGRDIVVGSALIWGRRRGVEAPAVTFPGKAATAGLYLGLPLAFLGFDRWEWAYWLGLTWTALAAIMYWASGVQYVRDIRSRAKTQPGVPAHA